MVCYFHYSNLFVPSFHSALLHAAQTRVHSNSIFSDVAYRVENPKIRYVAVESLSNGVGIGVELVNCNLVVGDAKVVDSAVCCSHVALVRRASRMELAVVVVVAGINFGECLVVDDHMYLVDRMSVEMDHDTNRNCYTQRLGLSVHTA